MGETGARYLPWQAPLLERVLALKHQQRLPHALLINSASATDQTPLLLHLAALLLCDQPDAIALCNACEACRMMQAGTYADFRLVTLIEDEKTKKINKNIKIEQIRDLIHEVSLTRRYTRLKIVAIYPAEAMSTAGANALLKTLEEPAEQVLILLLTHNRGRIPVTIRSRCQSLGLHLPDAQQARDWLAEQDISADESRLYLEYAGGDPALALALKSENYAQLVAGFKTNFGRFLRGEASVVEICRELLGFPPALLRRLMQMTLTAYCYQLCGVNSAAESSGKIDPERARRLFELRLRAQNQLRTEENNLDLQIQLEDVLISLKQILSRRTI